MEKNTLIAIVLSSIVFLVFMYFQSIFNPPPNQVNTPVAIEQTIENVVESKLDTELVEKNDPDQEEVLSEETYTITTNKVKVTFTNRGGDIISYQLLDHSEGDHNIEMADSISEKNRAFALSLGSAEAKIVNELFSVKQIDTNTIVFYKSFSVKNNVGSENDNVFIISKQYTFDPDDYMFKLDIDIRNPAGQTFGSSAYTLRTPPQIGPYFDAKIDRYENRTFMSFSGVKKKKTLLGANKTKEYTGNYTWTGVGGKYFAALVAPANPDVMQTVKYSAAVEVNNYANAQLFLQRAPLQERNTKDTYYVYIGPLTEKTLAIYDKYAANPWGVSALRLNESLSSTGVLSWLETGLKWCLQRLYSVIPNWGIAIILLTIILKILLFPLTRKSSLATLRMQELQPQMAEIQAKYKGAPEKLNVELAKFYKEANYNPMSGCLPLLIQFPLLYAMFRLFNNYFEFRGAMFIPDWIPDLSLGDSILTFGFSIPFGLGDKLRILPFIYILSQLLSTKLSQPPSSAGANATQMKILMYGMPLAFFFIFYNAPAGLLIYWTTSNILQLFQQMIINKIMKAKKAELARAKANEIPAFVPRKRKK